MLIRITESRKAYTKMLNSGTGVQVSDTTGDDSSNAAKYIIIQLTPKELLKTWLWFNDSMTEWADRMWLVE